MMLQLCLSLLLQAGVDTTVEGVSTDGRFIVGKTETLSPYMTVEPTVFWYEEIGGERTDFEAADEKEEPPHEFKKWKAARKFVPLISSRTSPDGKITLEVLVKPVAKTDETTWTNEASLTVFARIAERRVYLTETTSSFEAKWTPDSKGLVLITSTQSLATGIRGMTQVVNDVSVESFRPLDPTLNFVGPSVKLAHAAAAKVDVDASYSFGVARKKRDQTVIYFRKGFQPLAQKVQAALRGSTVEPLTWDSAFDVVVAVGGK